MTGRTVVLLLCISMFAGVAFANDTKFKMPGFDIEGGASAGVFSSAKVYAPEIFDTGINIDGLDYRSGSNNALLNDLFIEMHSHKGGDFDGQLKAGFGTLSRLHVLDGNGNHLLNKVYKPVLEPASTGSTINTDVTEYELNQRLAEERRNELDVYYAQIGVSPVDYLLIEGGLLASNIGYEVSPSFANWNATLGLLWMRQPTYYPGMRVSYEVEDLTPYFEYTGDNSTGGTRSWVLGLMGQFDGFRYSAGYFNADRGRDLLDLMVEAKFSHITAALNFNYHIIDNTPENSFDRSALAVAAYIIPSYREFDFPVRLEYISEGDSGIYGLNRAFTLTFTPTMNLGDNIFIRAEVSYLSSYNIVFRGLEDDLDYFNKTSFALHVGYYL